MWFISITICLLVPEYIWCEDEYLMKWRVKIGRIPHRHKLILPLHYLGFLLTMWIPLMRSSLAFILASLYWDIFGMSLDQIWDTWFVLCLLSVLSCFWVHHLLLDMFQPKTPLFSTVHLIWVNYKALSQLYKLIFL